MNDMRYHVGGVLEGAGAEELGEGRFADAGVACENQSRHGFCARTIGLGLSTGECHGYLLY